MYHYFYFHVLNGFAFCWQVLGTPTCEEIQCMNRNYTVFVFRHIKAHPWHKECEIYLSHYTNPALHCILSELGRSAACPCSSRSSCCWGTWWWLERPTSSPLASSQWVVLLHLNEWMLLRFTRKSEFLPLLGMEGILAADERDLASVSTLSWGSSLWSSRDRGSTTCSCSRLVHRLPLLNKYRWGLFCWREAVLKNSNRMSS